MDALLLPNLSFPFACFPGWTLGCLTLSILDCPAFPSEPEQLVLISNALAFWLPQLILGVGGGVGSGVGGGVRAGNCVPLTCGHHSSHQHYC